MINPLIYSNFVTDEVDFVFLLMTTDFQETKIQKTGQKP